MQIPIQRNHQAQFELFPGSAGGGPQPVSSQRLLKDLTLSVENIIVLCIAFVMVLVLFYSFGVEKGKRIVRASAAVPALEEAAIPHPAVEQPALTAAEPLKKTEAPQETKTSIRPQTREVEIPPPQEIVPSGAFTIQVASFKTQENANKEALRLKQKGYEIFILSKGKHSIVCVGKFPRHDEAKGFLNKLKGRYNDCLVRRL